MLAPDSVTTERIRKSKAQRELEKAAQLLRRPGARLLLMHANRPLGMQWFIAPGGPVTAEVAAKLIDRPDVCGCSDGLFPGHDQTWRLA